MAVSAMELKKEIIRLRVVEQDQAAEIALLQKQAAIEQSLRGMADYAVKLEAEQHKVKVLMDALRWAAERIDPIETKEYEKDDDCHCPVCNALGPVKGE